MSEEVCALEYLNLHVVTVIRQDYSGIAEFCAPTLLQEGATHVA
jgi:hypothetical protein